MTSAAEILSQVSTLRPNKYEAQLPDFLESLELKIKAELLGEKNPVYNPDSLSLGSPNDGIYYLYLFSAIDFLNGEYGRYENSRAEYTAFWDKLAYSYAEKKNNTKGKIKLW